MMKSIGVIPARWASTRFPGKVLAKIQGKPMIQHVWERARQCQELDELIIACDAANVEKAAKDFGAQVVMTSADHPSGSDRIAEAVAHQDCEIIVNIQGDEPFIDSKIIDGLVLALKTDKTASMATVIKETKHREDLENPHVVKVVIDANGFALYFSRSAIPFNRNKEKPADLRYFKHIGLYAYRKDFLMQYKDWPKSMLESSEQLEQLRVLEAGYRIKTIETHHDTIAVDTPEDLVRVERIALQKQFEHH